MVKIVNKGLEMIAKLLNGIVATPFTYLAVGSGSTAEDAAQTALVTELTDGGLARAAATCTYEASYKAKWTKTFSVTLSRTVRETGIFDAASVGNMYLRHVWASNYDVVNGDTVTVTITSTMSTT